MLSKVTKSLKIYCIAVSSVHILIFAYFFPVLLIRIIFIPLIFVVLWIWCDLVHTIEEANRNDILNLLYISDCDETKIILAHQLFLHDQRSLAGGHPFNSHGI
jgi:hypothetical protein